MPQKALVSGGGIAGAVLAYWLGKNDYEVVVLERSKSQTQAGQIIDVEGPAQEIVTRMGLIDKIRASSTHEAGLAFYNQSNHNTATFPAGASGGLSNEIEIMRPVLANIFIKATDSMSNVEFKYGTTISSLEQTDSKVHATLHNVNTNTTTTEPFDLLVACDGVRSTTRDLIFPPSDLASALYPLNASIAFFTIPSEPVDTPYFRVCNAPHRRMMATKPQSEKSTSAMLGYIKHNQPLHDARVARDIPRQKSLLAEIFSDAGWESDRIIRGMNSASNFYFEELEQIRLPRWSLGRAAVLGDAAYAPTPLTGQGTNLAILGAYVLASKLVANGEDVQRAFKEYEGDMRPYVNKVQPVPLWGYLPKLVNPETAWGVWVLSTIVSWVCWLGLHKALPDIKNEGFELPDL